MADKDKAVVAAAFSIIKNIPKITDSIPQVRPNIKRLRIISYSSSITKAVELWQRLVRRKWKMGSRDRLSRLDDIVTADGRDVRGNMLHHNIYNSCVCTDIPMIIGF